MIRFEHGLAGGRVQVNFVEDDRDLDEFDRFVAADLSRPLGFDLETTGLDIFSPGFQVRLAQFGSRDAAYVLRVDRFGGLVRRVLEERPLLVAHNAPFEGLISDRHLGVPLEVLAPKLLDSRVAAHLIDSRQAREGGVGHGLKALAARYVDPSAPDPQGDLTAVFRKVRNPETGKLCTKDNGWRHIPIDHPTYVLYAGLDPILTVRLWDELRPVVESNGNAALMEFEHRLQHVLMKMRRRGMLVDVEYTEKLRHEMAVEAADYRQVAAGFGVENIQATRQVAQALIDMGEVLSSRTATGQWRVDREVLLGLADLSRDWDRLGVREPNLLADAVLHAKRNEKWSSAYLDAMLSGRDVEDRIHAEINGLAARTGRMSVSGIPLQQLPRGDWRIRRCLVADPGHVMISADYSQQELVALAGLSQDENLLKAVREGRDLHDFTTEMVYGLRRPPEGSPDLPAYERQRSICKAVGLGKVYGGGAATLQRQTGAPLGGVKAAIAAYDDAFPGVKRLGYKIERDTAHGEYPLVTATGRRLMLDRDRTYAGINYLCQSVSRDVTAQALINLDAAGLSDHVHLVVHDEVIASAPAGDADELCREISEAMTIDALGVTFRAEAETKMKRSWGSLKGAPE